MQQAPNKALLFLWLLLVFFFWASAPRICAANKTPLLEHTKDKAPSSVSAVDVEAGTFMVFVDMEPGYIKDKIMGDRLADHFLSVLNNIYLDPKVFYVDPSLLVVEESTRSDALRATRILVRLDGVARCRLELREYYLSDFDESDSESGSSSEDEL